MLADLAANPATPAGDLLELVRAHGGPAADGLRRRRDLPPAVVEAMLRHPEPLVRAALAVNPATPAQVRMRLADDPDRLVALRVVNEQTLPRSEHALRREVERYVRAFERGLLTWQELHGELSFNAYDDRRLMHPIARHPHPQVRAAAFGWLHLLDEATRQALLDDEAPEVRAAAADRRASDADGARPRLPGELPPDGRGRFRTLVAYPLTRALIDEVLAGDAEEDLIALGGNKHLPPEVVDVLIAHPGAAVRREAAERTDLTGRQLARLAADPDAAVRTTVSVHAGLTEAQRAAIDIDATTFEDGFFVHAHAGWSWPRPAREESVAWAGSVNPLLRRRAARDPRLPADLVARLAADDDPQVRAILARSHPLAG